MNNSKVKNVGSDHLVTKDADCWLIWSISDLGVIMGEKERARREEICVPIELYHMPAGRPMPSLSGIFSLKHESSIFRSVILYVVLQVASQFSMGQTIQSLTCFLKEIPHTGLDD